MVLSFRITRKLSIFSCLLSRRATRKTNPGLGHQINIIDDAVKVIESDPEGFQGLESELYNANQSHKQHEAEMKYQSDKIRRRIVKNKYFNKNPLPNFLTYAEKEHIRFLHSSDEEEWTVEKLAESFPANFEIIYKILKANWSPISSKRIVYHDAKVLENWERFKNGEYQQTVPKELSEHLKNFAERTLNEVNNFQNTIKFVHKNNWQKPSSNEFLSIIKPLEQKNINAWKTTPPFETKLKDKQTVFDGLDSETYIRGEIKNKKPITIHQLEERTLYQSKEDTQIYNEDKSLNQIAAQNNEDLSERDKMDDKIFCRSLGNTADYTEKFVLNEVVISEYEKKRFEISPTKDRIHIPRKLWRKGATYRANDCYYDDDGEFLYKVPGMTLK